MIMHAKQYEAVVGFSKRLLPNDEERWEMNWPRWLTQPRMDCLHFSSGLSMMLYELDLSEPLSVRFSVCAETTFAMCFVISGRTTSFYDGLKSYHQAIEAPYSLFYDLKDCSGVSHYDYREPLRCLAVYFDLEALCQILGDQMRFLPELDTRPAGGRKKRIQRGVACTPSMRMAAHQALACSLEPSHRRLFVESKGLELMGLFMRGLARQHARHVEVGGDHVPPADRDKLHAARDILNSRLAEPPSIADLSRQVGLNECKLKQLFKNQFQNTIYGYVQSERMRRAKIFLEQGMSVSQTASTLGYVNFSHFAAAFRKHHGASPSACKRNF